MFIHYSYSSKSWICSYVVCSLSVQCAPVCSQNPILGSYMKRWTRSPFHLQYLSLYWQWFHTRRCTSERSSADEANKRENNLLHFIYLRNQLNNTRRLRGIEINEIEMKMLSFISRNELENHFLNSYWSFLLFEL